MSVHLMQTNVDITDPHLRGLFDDIQGNILKGHGRDHARHVFLRLSGEPTSARRWLRGFAGRVTTAYGQHQQARAHERGEGSEPFITLLLSAGGYRALEIPEASTPDDKAFRAGMKDLEMLYDSRPRGDHKPLANPLAEDLSSWEEPFRRRIDVCITLAHDNDDEASSNAYLDQLVAGIEAEVEPFAEVLLVQTGHVLRNERGQVIEHFGFVDGVSNPMFLRGDLIQARASGSFKRYDPSAYLSLVLARDAGGGPWAHGSYFVYRKLQQNIKGFHDAVGELAQRLTAARKQAAGGNSAPGDRSQLEVGEDYAGALVVGRFPDGTPINEQMIAGWTNLPNDFNYDRDVQGRRCPFQAHNRKTNPRTDTTREFGAPPNVEYSRRIARRAISYGSTELRPDRQWTDAGLLFLCCQASIEYQYVFMQGSWCNNPAFLHDGTGIDPLCGTAEDDGPAHRWPVKWGIPEMSMAGGTPVADVEFRFPRVVRARGGEYFFAPSISFLESL